MEQAQNQNMLHPEATAAYGSQRVINALQNSSWFTSEFIAEIRANEPDPEREGLGPFKDRLLGDFFIAGVDPKQDNEVYLGALNYVHQRMVGEQGHPFSLEKIPFCDDEILAMAKSFGVAENYEVDRRMIGQVATMLQCMIAPEEIRRKVIRVICSWGSDRVKRDTLLWAGLVGKGVKAYLKSRDLKV